jgi:poly(A) polymerase
LLILLLIFREGLVEAKLRQLVMKLEATEHLVIAHPFIKGFRKIHRCRNDEEATAAAHGNPLPVHDDTANENGDAENIREVYTTTFYIGLCVESRPGK